MYEMKIKNSVILVLVIILAAALAILAFAILNSMFPEAAPVSYPNADSITSLSLIRNDGFAVSIDAADFDEFLHNISSSQPTRIWSVQDYPTVQTYYTIEISTPDRVYSYFIYTENSQVYLELPYEGVYKTDQHFLDSIEEYFNE